MPRKMILIRHGQTDWNRCRRYCGSRDVELNETGKSQAGKLFEALNGSRKAPELPVDEEIGDVYCSGAKRTVQFAGIAFPNKRIKEAAALREINFGIFEGLTYDEIMDKYPELYQEWLRDPSCTVIPGGENLTSFAGRIRQGVSDILSDSKEQVIALVTHAGPIRVILCDIFKFSLKDIWRVTPKSASITVVEFGVREAVVSLENYISYLNG